VPGIIINLSAEEAGILKGYGIHRGIIDQEGEVSDVAEKVVGDLVNQWRENAWRSGVTPEGELLTLEQEG
jgi:hypothetical protein